MKERKDFADECFSHYEREMDSIHHDLKNTQHQDEQVNLQQIGK